MPSNATPQHRHSRPSGRPWPRAALAARTIRVAVELRRVAGDVDAVLTTPVFTDAGPKGPRIATHVHLVDVLRLPLAADAGTARAAYEVLRRAFPHARWDNDEYRYDVRSGALVRLTPDAPAGLR
ncbi:hypothetical protein [Streptomyces sp. NPDC047070]|uniref:hypothetical protein n=1 Tax=Streptomyces sp. NPDC047070 TaxID=3154923 RepID=UPI0034522685